MCLGKYLRLFCFSLCLVLMSACSSSFTSSSELGELNSSDVGFSKVSRSCPIPEAPTNLMAQYINSRVSLNWQHPSSVYRFRITKNGANIARVRGNVFSYVDSNVVRGATYTYGVAAIADCGSVSSYARVSITIPSTSATPTPAPTATPVPTATPRPSATPAPTPVQTATPRPTATPTPAPTAVPTATPAPSSGCANCPVPNVSLIPVGYPGLNYQYVEYSGEQPEPVDDIGAFRTMCKYSHMGFDDPIVFPGQPGRSHLHVFFGNTGTNAYTTNDSLRASGNSTCGAGTLNRSAYWAPAMIDTYDGRPIAPRIGNFYYKTGYYLAHGSDPLIRAFPPGHRMITGSASSTGPQEGVLEYTCDDVDGGTGHYNEQSKAIPNCQPGDELIMEIEFPQCGNGQLDSPDHKSHMAFPVNGRCPSTHPIAHPVVTMNMHYVVGSRGTAAWRLSSDNYLGGPGGYSGHADWMNGWSLNFTGTASRPLPAQSAMEFWIQNIINIRADGHSHLLGNGYSQGYPDEFWQ